MKVPGKKLQSTKSAIDGKCCKPCYEDGDSVQAEAYCTSCKKGLCATCVIAHRKQVRSHLIIDQMYDEESYEQCERHPKEFIKYYCPKHDSLICGHCSVLEHGSCKVEIISELCKSDYESINDDNADLLTNSDGSAAKIAKNMDLLTDKDTAKELLASKTGIGTMKEKHVAPRKKQLFASCITKGLVLLVGIAIIGIIVQVLVINKGDDTPVDLTSLRYTRAPDIPVNGLGSEMLFLSGERMLIFDRDYNKSKMIDLHTNNLMFEVSLRARPWSMCILPGDRLAVSLPGKERIQFLKTRGQLSLGGNIKVDGKCFGIGYHNYRLIVSYRSGKVEIMDMTGKVIKTIDKDDRGHSIFSSPMYLRVVSEVKTSVIYVSNFGKFTINKLDMNLNILQTFQDPALIYPTGITTVGNQLLVCGWGSNNIMFLNLLSGKMTQLLGEVEGIYSPLSVVYNHNKKTMYVYPHNGSSVLVYKAD